MCKLGADTRQTPHTSASLPLPLPPSPSSIPISLPRLIQSRFKLPVIVPVPPQLDLRETRVRLATHAPLRCLKQTLNTSGRASYPAGCQDTFHCSSNGFLNNSTREARPSFFRMVGNTSSVAPPLATSFFRIWKRILASADNI